MSHNAIYRYNPDTDNYERIYVSWKKKVGKVLLFLLSSAIFAAAIVTIVYYSQPESDEARLRRENSSLRSQYGVLNRRLDNSLEIMKDIQARDDNFYRVMMQMDPLSSAQRFAGLDNEKRYKELKKLGDNGLIKLLNQRLDLFDRQLYAQSISFDQLKEAAGRQQDKLDHIPSIIPIHVKDYTMSSGYGYRVDPIYGTTKFHAGLDFAAHMGTPVFATADGVVAFADRKTDYGNCIDISHGYNYSTRYGHLSEILVKPGQEVKRGDLIGKVGSTGKSTGPHLHYEVRFKDEPQNPVNYYFMDITSDQYASMIRDAENAGHVMD